MKRTIIAVSLLLVAGMLTGCSKDSNQSVKQPAFADSSQTTGAPSVALVPVSQTGADSKATAMAEAVSFLNRHFVMLDNSAGRLKPTGFRVEDGRVIFEFDDSDPGKPMTHMVYSALAADLDPDSVADLNGSLWVDCKNLEPCVSKPEATADHKRIIIGPYAEDYSREAKQHFKRILFIQQGQSPEAAAKQSADSHKGEQFWGWNCKDFMRVNTDRNASVELTGPVMVHHQQSMSVIVFLARKLREELGNEIDAQVTHWTTGGEMPIIGFVPAGPALHKFDEKVAEAVGFKIKNLKMFVKRETGTVTIIVDCQFSRKEDGGLNYFMVRLFDENGEYITHFQTKEVFAQPNTPDPRGFHFQVLKAANNVLQYRVSRRDADYIQKAEFGFLL